MLALDIGDFFFGSSGGPFKSLEGVGILTSAFLSNALIVAGVVFIFLIIFAGFRMISGAGGNPAQFQQGQQMITAAIIGFIIVLLAYWIVAYLQASLDVNIIY